MDDRISELEQEVAAERRARQALVESSVRLNSLLNLPDLLSAIAETVAPLLGAETSSILLLDEETNELVFEVATGDPGSAVRELRVPADRGIAGWVLQQNAMAVVDDVATDSRFYGQIDASSGFQTQSMLAVPLAIRDHPIGVLEVINKQEATTFSERDQELATAFAAQAAIAIDNARLYRQLADAVIESRLSYRL